MNTWMLVMLLAPFTGPPPATGFWDNKEVQCPSNQQWSDVTRLPQLCLAHEQCACYRPAVHTKTAGIIGKLRKEKTEIQGSLVTCGKKLDKTLGLLKSCRESRDAALKALREVPEPPSRLTWFSLGVGAAGVSVLALVLVL